MRISDWSSDVCSSDLPELRRVEPRICDLLVAIPLGEILTQVLAQLHSMRLRIARVARELLRQLIEPSRGFRIGFRQSQGIRSEEHTSELQSLMRISYAVFCLKKKKK